MAKPRFYFYCYPWDLEDEGLEVSLGRLAGEIGVDGITVAATTPEVYQFRPRKSGKYRVFRTEAGAHFQPDSTFYTSTRIKPHPAVWMRSRNSLERIVKVCHKEKLKIRASVCCCVGRATAKRYPFAACINVLGVPSDRVLCPSNPEVKSYLCALVEDLTSNYGLESLELTDLRYLTFGDYDDREFCIPCRSDAAMELLALCFCSSCRQAAIGDGLDAEHIEALVRKQIDTWLDVPDSNSQTVNDLYSQSKQLPLLRVLQSKQLNELGALLKNHSQNHVSIGLRAPGYAYDRITTQVDKACVNIEELSRLRSNAAYDPHRISVAIPIQDSEYVEPRQLVSTVHEASKTPFDSISFSSYGIAQQPTLDAIRQAIRYAKRESIG